MIVSNASLTTPNAPSSLQQAGNYVREEILSAFIRLVAHTPELQAYTASKLYILLKSDISQEALTLAAVWMMGEYTEVIGASPDAVDDGANAPIKATDADFVSLLVLVLDSPYANYLIRQFVLMAMTKMTGRSITTPSQQERIVGLLAKYATSPELELQQRAVEFSSLYGQSAVRVGVLERMPAPEIKATVLGVGMDLSLPFLPRFLLVDSSLQQSARTNQLGQHPTKKYVHSTPFSLRHSHQTTHQADLLGDDLASPTAPSTNGQQASAQRNEDLLAEIFGGSAPSASSPPPAAQQKSSVNDILGLFGSTPAAATSPPPSYSSPVAAQAPSAFSLLGDLGDVSSPTPQPAAPAPAPAPAAASAAPRLQSYTTYDKNNLTITLTPQTNPAKPGFVNILARFQVTGSEAATNVNFQAAVPKVSLNPFVVVRVLKRYSNPPDSTAADAAHVEQHGQPRCDRDTAITSNCTTRGMLHSLSSLVGISC